MTSVPTIDRAGETTRRARPPAFLDVHYRTLSDATISHVCFIQIFSLIYLQKLAIPLGSTPPSLLLVIQIATAVYLVLFCHAGLDIAGVLTFLAFSCLCLLGQAQAPHVSWPSLLQLIALNATFIVVLKTPRALYCKILSLFHRMMIVPACIVVIQRILLSIGAGDVLNIERILPEAILLPGYTYAAEFGWGTGVIRPNGLFFLEPSFASGFLATAAIVDYVFLRRFAWAAFFLGACLSTSASTGMVVLGLFAVCLVARKSIVLVGLLALIALAALATISADASLMSMLRLDELTNEKSSGYGRLVAPMIWLCRLVMDGAYWFKGDGAGSVTEDVGSAWPIVKLTYEYGLAAAIMYLVFILTNARRATLPVVMLPLLLVHQFTGGYLVQPAWIGLLTCLCTMFVATPEGAFEAATANVDSGNP
jgi:hypothetical protein